MVATIQASMACGSNVTARPTGRRLAATAGATQWCVRFVTFCHNLFRRRLALKTRLFAACAFVTSTPAETATTLAPTGCGFTALNIAIRQRRLASRLMLPCLTHCLCLTSEMAANVCIMAMACTCTCAGDLSFGKIFRFQRVFRTANSKIRSKCVSKGFF